MSDEIPEMTVSARTRNWALPISVVWLVPLIAVVIALAIAWQAYANRGPLITVSFEDASGITAKTTPLKFRNLTVGTVESIDFSPDLKSVIASIRLEKSIARFVDADARFWIVKPEVSASGITGLTTVLSGIYIEGSWNAEEGPPLYEFTALKRPPLTPDGVEGTPIRLRGDSGGQVKGGAPIVYRGVTVGQISEPVLAADGSEVTAEAFIRAPYDQLITTDTRFWAAGGFSVKVGPDGLSVNVANLSALVQGGVTFGTLVSGGQPVGTDQTFTVYADEATAKANLFARANPNAVTYSTVFEGAVAGLAPGAPVELAGLRVGEVTEMGAFIDETASGAVRLRVDFTLQPGRLGLPEDADEAAIRSFMDAAVAKGLHAQLENTGLLTSDLKIGLVDAESVAPGQIVDGPGPHPVIPALPVNVSDLSASAEGVVDRFYALPIEDLVQNTVDLLASLNALVNEPALKAAPGAAVGLIDDARAKVQALDPAPILADLKAATSDLKTLIASVSGGEDAGRIAAVMDRVDSVTAALDQAAQGLPALVDAGRQVAQNAAALDLAALSDNASRTVKSVGDLLEDPATRGLPAEVQGLLSDTRALLGQPAVQALPGDLAATLAQLRAMVTDLQQSGAQASLLASLQRLDAITASVQATVDGLPAMQAQLADLLGKADALPLEDLTSQASAVLGSANALLGSAATADLPATLNQVLAEVAASLGELRAGGTVENVNATLASARQATEALAAASQTLPELSARLNALTLQTETLMATYGDRSAFNTQTVGALNDLREAARAVSSLARTIERNPSSLIRGR